ncbi:UNVERIFIED_CONTAM: hypothetical protein HDU68_011359 [Siphonaria sp. JEL0065]|nr:hypothetical protein HDU68_011359 [Siphonaria sp. JEL0065]
MGLDNYIRPDDEVILLNAYRNIYPEDIDGFKQVQDANNKKSHALLAEYVTTLVAKKIQHRALSVLASGNVKEALVLELNEIKATTLIVGSRGSDLATRSLIGGVSDYLAHHVKIPVLIVKPTEEEVAKWGLPKHHVTALRVNELLSPIYPVQ